MYNKQGWVRLESRDFEQFFKPVPSSEFRIYMAKIREIPILLLSAKIEKIYKLEIILLAFKIESSRF